MNLACESAAAPVEAVWQSIRALTSFAGHAAGADGYALFELDHATEKLVIRDSAGVYARRPQKLSSGREVTSHDGSTVSSYPLHAEEDVSGWVTFAFRGT